MKLWNWLTSPDPEPGLTKDKMLKLMVRVLIFASIASVLSALLSLTPLKPYINTWWGSLIFVLLLYIPLARYMLPDSFAHVPRSNQGKKHRPTKGISAAHKRRKERQRFAGVKKSGPKFQGRR